MIKFLLLSLLAACFPLAALATEARLSLCGIEEPCKLGGRSYHVLPPDDWDGIRTLPVLMHFHGWMRQGSLVVKHQRIASATRKRGVLLIAPNGQGKTWNFWTGNTPDVPFATAVLQEVEKTYPIDKKRVFVSGYSFGSAMAWRYSCEDGEGVAALLAISGTIPQSDICATSPAEVRHVHGVKDTVMDFPMGPGGDLTFPVFLWRTKYGCGEGASLGSWQARSFLTFERTAWVCDGGRVTLDVHPGGHFIPHGWIARQLDELLGMPPSYP